MVKVNISIRKKDLWLLSAIFVFLIAVGYVIATNSGNPALMGHTADEIEVVKRIFVTNDTPAGNLGGLDQVDVWCMNAARHANLVGNWKAMLSISSPHISVRDRLNYNWDKLVNLNGDIVAQKGGCGSGYNGNYWDWAPWGAEISALCNPVAYNEFGNAVSGEVWTGSEPEGIGNSYDCNSWTTNSGSYEGTTGQSNSVNGEWVEGTIITMPPIDNSKDPCSALNRLYCIEQ